MNTELENEVHEETFERKRKPWIRRNLFWVVVGLYVVVYLGFVADGSVWNIYQVNRRVVSSKHKWQQIHERVVEDSLFLENLKCPDFVERIAREKYYMMRNGEQIYVIEYDHSDN